MTKKRPREEQEEEEEDSQQRQSSRGKIQKVVVAPHLQEEGSARVALRPRNHGEALKVAETVLRRRSQNLQEKAARAKKIRGLKRVGLSLRISAHATPQYFVLLLLGLVSEDGC